MLSLNYSEHHIVLDVLPFLRPINSFVASNHFCSLLINFANSLDPDQDQQIVGSDLDPNCSILDSVPEQMF